MDLKNIYHIEWWASTITWAVAIVEINSFYRLLPYSVVGIVLFIWLLNIRHKNRLKHSLNLIKSIQYLNVALTREFAKGFKLEVGSYSKEISEHLEDSAYKDEKETIERMNSYIKLYNEEAREFFTDLHNNIIDYIRQRNFIDGDTLSSRAEMIDFFNNNTIKFDLFENVVGSYPATPKSLSFIVRQNDNYRMLFLENTSNDWIISDYKREKELKEIGDRLSVIFDDAIKKFKFKLLLEYSKKINNDQICINQKLKQIIDKIETGTPFEGHCLECLKADFFWRINDGT